MRLVRGQLRLLSRFPSWTQTRNASNLNANLWSSVGNRYPGPWEASWRVPAVRRASTSAVEAALNNSDFSTKTDPATQVTIDAQSSSLVGELLDAIPPASEAEELEASFLETRHPVSRVWQYGRWQNLSVNPDRLKFEADLESPHERKLRLVDAPENANDATLWSCLLNFRYRRDGAEGVAVILSQLLERRTLHDVQGQAPQVFWQTIVSVALHEQDEAMLRQVYEYAEWMVKTHDVRWPNLYDTVVVYFLQTRQYGRAVRWHLSLMPSFDPGHTRFAGMLKEFATDMDRDMQDALRGLYLSSGHRQMYDDLIPYLYALGTSALARSWRVFLTRNNDMPGLYASRPFLRFVKGYFPGDRMSEKEVLAAGLDREIREAEDDRAQPHSIRELVNKVQGETFGIKEIGYNDALGARWFASSWISLDFALDIIKLLGIAKIGPLSLQSIALREQTSDRILHRLDQLEMFRIDIGSSNYARAIRHFAAIDDQETLMDLLRSDMHPDVFDDLNIQQKFLGAKVLDGDLKNYRLILAVRLAVSLDSVAVASNRLLAACLTSGNQRMSLRILDDMSARGIQIFPSTSHYISQHIIENIAPHAKEGEPVDLGYYAALCRRIMAMRFPLAAAALQRILYRLGRDGMLDELESLCFDIVRRYQLFHSSDRATLNVHKHDVPPVMKADSQYKHFQMIPRDLSLKHNLHPLQLIFDQKLQGAIVRWGFHGMATRHNHHHRRPEPRPGRTDVDRAHPRTFLFARGIRLLALLQERGVLVHAEAVQKAAILRLAEVYGTAAPLSRRIGSAKQAYRDRITLEEAAAVCNEAWGKDLLPGGAELEQDVAHWAEKRVGSWQDWAEKKRKRESGLLQ